ncbi:N-acetylmuramoyl-L-alanine amidase [Guptibacillus hwajinpoensis]|uniref:N-acetylmuramoyl-L-alanine amidase n=1 Tax=Guptibacillus hwajinpoensis TaxID=208199 RepID=UPI001CD5D5A5|nr:N-acetylmuramoyl-L-alanine amidase [Pseudalkalibacillus hwajinpoensis]MCA0993265.1 N-acetylmuramoyl-L-alanine amidase [Pseudalkalibacillus hwajinpoensis]
MIIIDAGHGGKDPGAIADGVKEKDWNLEVSLHQYEFLKKLGIPCKLTRKTDSDLSPDKRSELVRSSGATVCLSNHFNAGGGSGAEVIHSKYATSAFAKSIADALKKVMPVRRVFSREGSNGKDYYYMHRLTGQVETLIIEYGFLDSAVDRKKLNVRSYRFQLAEEAALAAVRYTKGSPIYFVQSGAYKEKSRAEQLCEELKNKGYDAFVKQEG